MNNFLEKFKNNLRILQSTTVFKISGFIGFYIITKSILRMLSWVKKYYLSFEIDFKKLYGDGWVIITGGSTGIGKALATQFAKRGHKILLIARDETKLLETANELRKLSENTIVEYLSFDLSQTLNTETLIDLKEKLRKYEDISILINNAALSVNDLLIDLDDNSIMKLINLNILSLIYLTKIVIEKMRNRKRSLIVGSGSLMYLIRPAYKSLYAASKCFMDAFQCSLARENPNIDFTYLEIGAVKTKHNINKYFLEVDSPLKWSNNALNHLGKYKYTSLYPIHGFVCGLFKKSPYLLKRAQLSAEKSILKRKLENSKK
jgi:short-subunit dehydrogenase